MITGQSLRAELFHRLCRVLGGQCPAALDECIDTQLFQPLFELASGLDLLPALAVRCDERNIGPGVIGHRSAAALRQALRDNTLRNMEISAQAIKLGKLLNSVGITPLFLKGTARLLASPASGLGFRKQVDIDLIVPAGQIEAAADVFLADGYSFYAHSGAEPVQLYDSKSAIRSGAAHHHLPPLEKDGCVASVELHRHFLDRRFQRNNPLDGLFDTARQMQIHGVVFQVASAEYQIIQLVLGKFVNDGHLAGRTFPVREACDLIEMGSAGIKECNPQFLQRRCGDSYPLFHALVCELMQYRPQAEVAASAPALKFIRMMDKRWESAVVRRLLDACARADYLSHALAHNPAKLPAYLRRQVSSQEL